MDHCPSFVDDDAEGKSGGTESSRTFLWDAGSSHGAPLCLLGWPQKPPRKLRCRAPARF